MTGRGKKQKASEPSPVQYDSASVDTNGTIRKGSKHKGVSSTRGEQKENIFLFWPNIIGYIRVVLAIASLYYMPLHPRTCSLLYSISCLLDALDGYAARFYNQSTTFGAVLDMVTDRCTTACLLVFLSSAWPRWAILFQGLISLDLASHYMHMYATLTMGGSGQSHKKVDSSRSWILYQYYNNKMVLFVFCTMNELFFIGLYLLSFSSPTLSPSLLQPVGDGTSAGSGQPGTPAMPPISTLFASPWSAGALELARANKMDSFWPWVITGISAPIMAAKQFINIVQMVKASKWLAEGDLARRRQLGLSKTK
ncbi:CDP-diacylglycerol-inositol 3-phosphatidyltransferase [Coccidioides posadasii str. Silveira]|uniref:CDP-diacylglycerol-inositol 3-phosphatidyltransferase PIS n=3 Tax=Coccidioides posadasii TaxID=199306 RepID=E9D3Y0_COCPS|nr:CDP-diacylglycerol--inositol 3-phosphatidyltransferase, putative [Coccidioides posadasii C735 delta SOWgp]EER26866.1 CDP-diacylglycerol--inositol 3-phosphatidyltransferase, putative [Coccidioides posadasii C735 delta SOWgp]EFW18773.1 CDP-diacylglycerol-inositol 3-phosphatidyltransferase PIS [Coccidioides posadasii str. Silveira]KMM72413.1 CDP diacylglycerol-inositol 3-phosphatidyltransferase [Coccidioides posadasii RMSCC 3488]QVM10931.1 CDP-diacylglycerol-inositol 3-phosphatidyltransferase [|eukprot:XP_003069011.1 CDP-diacylglycerol--inositol 3-phosphatidyltransferase, putative [Coccidioides posadasii C735 delta SOWgp]